MVFLACLFDWMSIKTVLVLVVVCLVVAWWMQKPRNLPPGPRRWPILGFFPQFAWYLYKGEEIHKLATRLGKEHGNLYSFDLFGYPFVVVNEFSMIREGFNNPLLSNKGYGNALQSRMFGRHAHSYQHNAQYRKFALSALRGFGIGKRSFEGNITAESKFLLEELNAFKGKPCNPHHIVANTAANVIFAVVFGRRYEYDDEDFKHLTELNAKIMNLLGPGFLAVSMPFTIPNKATRELNKVLEKMFKYIGKVIEEHREKFDPENLDDFVDVYLNEVEKNPKPEDPNSFLQRDNMKAALYTLFLGGADTTSSTLDWFWLYMLGYPNVQRKIQEELDSVVGRDRLPQLSDKENLPYTRAALLEIQRMVCLAPFADFHTAAEATTLRGYHIPKGSVVIGNLYAVMRNPELFPEPQRFKPERFINDNGEYFEPEEVCPFSVGRTMCLGNFVAKMELFIIFSHVVHQFALVKPDNTPPVSFEGERGGATSQPNQFSVKFVARE